VTVLATVYLGDLVHWCVAPMLACLVLTLVGALRAWRARLGVFDPLVWLEAFMVYLVGLAPLLHVVFRRYVVAPYAPSDYRSWMGAMAAFNLLGLAVRWVLTTSVYRARASAPAMEQRRFEDLEPWRVTRLLLLCKWSTVGAASALVVLVAAAGGPAGFARETALRDAGFQGLGTLTVAADLLPMAALLWWLVAGLSRTVPSRHLWWALVLACSAQFLISGLRGSRIQLVFFGLIAVGWLWWRGMQVRRRTLGAMVLLALVFSYGYTLYKDVGGAKFVRVVTFQESKPDTANHRDLGTLLLGDLSRADVQANMLWNVVTHPTPAPLAMGRTYVADVLVHVPSAVRPDVERWSKVQVGGARLFGVLPEGFRPGYIYGLAGEALLNFGVLAVLPAMVLHAWLVRVGMTWADRRLRSGTPVQLLWPVLTIVLITAWMSDLDQVIYMTLRFALLPCALVLLAWRRPRGAAPSPATRQ
jgi:hypothetical protein